MVFRERRPSRHRAAEGLTPDAAPGRAEPLALGATLPPLGLEDVSPSEQTTRFDTLTPFQLRLPELRIEQLRTLAEARGVSPAALAQDWLLERLDLEDPPFVTVTPAPAPRREADAVTRAEPLNVPEPPEVPGAELVAEDAAPVTPLFRNPPGAHASAEEKDSGPRHRAPDPVISLHSRRKP
jgi:hypothetical protein